MRRWLAGITAGTFVALAYTHQHILLIEARYAIEQREQLRADMLDQYRILLYNVLTLQAPLLLEQRLAVGEVELVSPHQINWLTIPTSPSVLITDKRGAPGLLIRSRQWVARVLTPRATAEAQPGP